MGSFNGIFYSYHKWHQTIEAHTDWLAMKLPIRLAGVGNPRTISGCFKFSLHHHLHATYLPTKLPILLGFPKAMAWFIIYVYICVNCEKNDYFAS